MGEQLARELMLLLILKWILIGLLLQLESCTAFFFLNNFLTLEIKFHNTHKTQWQPQLFALGSAGNYESVTQTQRVTLTLLLTYALSIVEVAILMFVFNSVLFI